jgi:hypothetical protein
MLYNRPGPIKLTKREISIILDALRVKQRSSKSREGEPGYEQIVTLYGKLLDHSIGREECDG